LTWLAAVSLTAGLCAQSSATAPTTLDRLTVPADRLPAGCGLRAAPNPGAPRIDDGTVVAFQMEPPTNPWVTSRRGDVAQVRRMVDGMPRQLDGPPLGGQQAALFDSAWSEHLLDAYQAKYDALGSQVMVAAVRFGDAALAAREPAGLRRRQAGVSERLVIGPIAIRVSASRSDSCYGAILAHLKSLAVSVSSRQEIK
jgi:hypothetical protein